MSRDAAGWSGGREIILAARMTGSGGSIDLALPRAQTAARHRD